MSIAARIRGPRVGKYGALGQKDGSKFVFIFAFAIRRALYDAPVLTH
jgi:hypothetical protein